MDEQSTPMEIGNASIILREECMRRNLCVYCKEPRHCLSDCRKRQAGNSQRGSAHHLQGRNSFRANQSSFRRVVDGGTDYVDDADDYVENGDDYVGDIDSLQLNMASVDASQSPKHEIYRFEGVMNDRPVRVLIDSGAENNIMHPGLGKHYVVAAKGTAERFDGTTTLARTAQRCMETVAFNGMDFAHVSLTEWEVASNQGVVLGHPWLVQFNPVIN